MGFGERMLLKMSLLLGGVCDTVTERAILWTGVNFFSTDKTRAFRRKDQ